MNIRPLRLTLAVLPLTLVTATAVVAQQTPTALEVTVRSAHDDQPLGGAQVMIEGLGLRGITGASGFVSIDGLPVGPRLVEVRYLGYTTLREPIVFEMGETRRLIVRLIPQPIALAEVRVRATRSLLAARGFFDRRRFGQGTFYTREELERMRPRYLSDVLRRSGGIAVGTTAYDRNPSARMRGQTSLAGECPIQYYLDGTLTAGFNIDYVAPDDVEGLEIYRGASTIPPEYNKGTAMCGVILIWTRIE